MHSRTSQPERGRRAVCGHVGLLVNAMRGLATEFGLTVPKGISRLGELTALVGADEAFPETARRVFTELHQQFDSLEEGIDTIETQIVAHARGDETARRLATIPSIGPITASLIAATVTDVTVFKSARGIVRLTLVALPGAGCRFVMPVRQRSGRMFPDTRC